MERLTMRILLLLACIAEIALLPCQAAHPVVGSQVWFAPGEYDQPEEIDHVFRTMAEQHITLARISLVRNYLEPSPGKWDFTLFDRVFASAEKYNVKIAATIWPYAKAPNVGQAAETEADLQSGERYLEKVIARYRSSRALDTWIVRNEPGQPPANNPLAMARFRVWLQKKYKTIDALNQAWLGDAMWPYREAFRSFDEITYDDRWQTTSTSMWPVPLLDWKEFWRGHLAWFLDWISSHVRAIDSQHPLHTNAAGGGSSMGRLSQDLPVWRGFLDTLGVSAYPGFYQNFGPDRYTFGLSYSTDLLRGVMEPKPIWITEMPANTMSLRSVGDRPPFTTDSRQMAQWVWMGIGGGAERMVFWLFNARYKSREVGEFGMLDHLGHPSDRLKAVSSVARTIDSNAPLFDAAKPVEPPVTLIVSLESMSLQDARISPTAPDRERNAHMHCLMGVYRALNELGVNARIKHIHDFDWRAKTSRPRLVILPHVVAMSTEDAADVEAFVRNGNTVLATGLTGFYDPQGRFWPMFKNFPLESVFGARPLDVSSVGEKAHVEMIEPRLVLPANVWVTEISNRGAEVIGQQHGRVTAVRHKLGQGESIWIPAPVGVAALSGDNKPLAQFLRTVLTRFNSQIPFRFAVHEPDMLLRTMKSGSSYVTMTANTSHEAKRVHLQVPAGLKPKLIWGAAGSLAGDGVLVPARDTVVLQWR